MNEINISTSSTRRQFLAGTLTSAGALALAGNAMCAQKKYAPRIVCNMFLWCQLFSTPFRYISSAPDPKEAPPPSRQPARDGEELRSEHGRIVPDQGPFVVPQDCLYVLGERYLMSRDSRFWGFVKTSNVIGRPELIYASWNCDRQRVRWSRILREVR